MKEYTEYIVRSYPDKTEYRNMNGQLHRLDGPAIEWSNGYKSYYVNGQLNRLDGPAIECPDGSKKYYVNDQLNRLDGPAVEYTNGNKEYWVDGKQYSEHEFNKLRYKNDPMEMLREILNNLSKNDPMEMLREILNNLKGRE